MKPSLQLRLSQQLALTPQLQQSIRLLQLSTLELNQELEQILAENPLLERLDDPLADCARIAPNGSLDHASAADGSAGASASPADGGAGPATADDAHDPREVSSGAESRDADGGTDGYGEHGVEWGGESRGLRAENDDDEREYDRNQLHSE